MQIVDGDILSTTGANKRFCLRGNPGTTTITVAWHDYPGTPTAAKALINDLDLTVVVGGSLNAPFLGNGAADRVNNVERVRSNSIMHGIITVSYEVLNCPF